jgi:Bacterial regulatory protein, Fis family
VESLWGLKIPSLVTGVWVRIPPRPLASSRTVSHTSRPAPSERKANSYKGERIELSDLAYYLKQSALPVERRLPLDTLLEQVERQLIALALKLTQNNQTRAAELLEIWRPRLMRRIAPESRPYRDPGQTIVTSTLPTITPAMSETVMVWRPGVSRITPPGNVTMPASVDWKG